MSKWRIWHSAKSFCDFIIDNTILANYKNEIEFKSLAESDASKSGAFHQVPDHIKKILYLDAADLILEYNSEPIVCIEETKEAGTGHNSMQRFARIAAAVENNVPAIYIMPEATIITRKKTMADGCEGISVRWDAINPIVFHAFTSVMDIFKIPALFFYYPTDYRCCANAPQDCRYIDTKGIIFNSSIKYAACPTEKDDEMQKLFEVLNKIIQNAIDNVPVSNLIDERVVKNRRNWMQKEFYKKLGDREIEELSPITATITIPTEMFLNYLSNFTDVEPDKISELLSSREETIIYQCDAKFRGDPYAGTLAAIDYLLCRRGKTYEERDFNLVLCFGSVDIYEDDTMCVNSNKCSVNDFIKAVQRCGSKNLLTIDDYNDLRPCDIGRYYMQVRYGSTYSKVKHIRVFSYFADAVIFKDGALWREA